MNPDSAVPAETMSEEQTFRSEVNGSLPLSGHRSSWSKMKSKICNGEARSSEKDFGTLQLGAFATPGLLLAQGSGGLTAESGMNRALAKMGKKLFTWSPMRTSDLSNHRRFQAR
jgi:hypothetical protein